MKLSIALGENDPDVYGKLADVLNKENKLEEAKDVAQKAIVSGPPDTEYQKTLNAILKSTSKK